MKLLITYKQLTSLVKNTIKEKFMPNDGGRKASGYRRNVGDCVTRAIAIALGKPYTEVFKAMNNAKKANTSSKGSASQGMYFEDYAPYLEKFGWKYVKLENYINFTKEQVDKAELPKGILVLRANVKGESSRRSRASRDRSLSNHLVTITNDENEGMIHDTYACDYGGSSTIVGYFYNPKVSTLPKKEKEIVARKTSKKPFYAITWEYGNRIVYNLKNKFDWQIIQKMANTYPKLKNVITSPLVNVYEIQDEDIRFKYKFHRTTSLGRGSYMQEGIMKDYLLNTNPLHTINLEEYSQEYGKDRYITKVITVFNSEPIYYLHTKEFDKDKKMKKNITNSIPQEIETKKISDSTLNDIEDNSFVDVKSYKTDNYDLIKDVFDDN